MNRKYTTEIKLLKQYSKNKYTEDYIVNMLEFLVDNIFVVFGVKVFQ